MVVKKIQYEALLAEYSSSQAAIALLKQYRPYLEMIPSMRRANESLIPIPLPLVHLRPGPATANPHNQIPEGLTTLPCDVGIILCDPEWKIKTGAEIFVFIHRPDEDFSDLLGRWRKTQTWLDRGYEWLMPTRYKHIISEGSDRICPLFVIFPETPERIQKGLQSSYLPFVVETSVPAAEIASPESLYPEGSIAED